LNERWSLLILGLGLWSVCHAAQTAAGPATPLRLSGAWVRALPPGQPATAAYLTVENAGKEELVITAASADIAGRAEMHNSREIDGMMRMERVGQLPLAPGEVVEFAPGGLHLMLLELKRMPSEGEIVSLCLQPVGLQRVCADARVLRNVDGHSMDHHGHH
jgi:copper(I)-binding protein